MQFECLTDSTSEVGILAEIPYQMELPQDFVEEHMASLLTGRSTICIPGGRAIRLPNSTMADQVIVPQGAEIQMVFRGELPMESIEPVTGNRSVLVVRVSGTSESPGESVERLAGAVFGLGNEPLRNSMRAQFGRCSFSKLDFTPASGFPELYNGVVDIQLDYSVRGRNTFRVLNDAATSVAVALGVNSLASTFDHVMFCIARGTINVQEEEDWLAFADLRGWRSTFNSDRCDSLSFLMHEIGHNLDLVHSSHDIFEGDYGDTTGMVSPLLC